MFNKKAQFTVIDKETGQKIKNVKVDVKEENKLKAKLSEALERINALHGNISGLTFAEFGEIIKNPKYQDVVQSNVFEYEKGLDEYEIMTRVLIMQEVFQEHGIIFE